MKNKILWILGVISILLVFPSANRMANALQYDNLTYIISNNTVTITDCLTSATEVEIPSAIDGYPVTSIGNNAFENCQNLISVTIPNTISSIEDFAFYGCSNLIRVTIPNSVSSIGEYAFSECSNLVNITLPNSISSIENFVFSGCANLVSINIPDSVSYIGVEAFYDCNSLISVTIPNSVSSIDHDAFHLCHDLSRVHITDIEKWCAIDFCSPTSNPLGFANNLYLNGKLIKDLVIPDSVSSIGAFAFYGCSSIFEITIPSSVSYIGGSAFYDCSNLNSVYISDIAKWCTINFRSSSSNPLYYANNLYINNKIVENLIIPDNITSISKYAFYNCTSLTQIELGSSTTLIETYAFHKCKNLKYICLPKELKHIENNAFSDCTDLSKVFFSGSEDEWTDILIDQKNGFIIIADIIYNAQQKTYKLETNCNISLPDITTYCIFSKPQIELGGKTLAGWYDNALLSGEPITFPYYGNAETLYAKWIDNEGTPQTKTVCITSATGEKIFSCIPSNLPETSQIILACYDGKALVQTHYVTNTNETIYFVVTKEFNKAKIMVWENLYTMIPIINEENVEL